MRDFTSVVIPAYNEEERIRPTLERVWQYFTERAGEFEIIIVDDGSSDLTAAIVEEMGRKRKGIRLIRYPENAGKGNAIRTGVLSSRGDLLLISDADLSTPIEEQEKMIPFIEDGFDIAVGSRGLRGSEIVVRQAWYREGMGKTFNVLVRMLLLGGIRDTQCGFKLFRTDVAKRLFEKGLIRGFSFDVEILYLARKMGYRVKETPVRWYNSPHSKVKLFRDPLGMFLDLLRIRFYWLMGKYRDRDCGTQIHHQTTEDTE